MIKYRGQLYERVDNDGIDYELAVNSIHLECSKATNILYDIPYKDIRKLAELDKPTADRLKRVTEELNRLTDDLGKLRPKLSLKGK